MPFDLTEMPVYDRINRREYAVFHETGRIRVVHVVVAVDEKGEFARCVSPKLVTTELESIGARSVLSRLRLDQSLFYQLFARSAVDGLARQGDCLAWHEF